jgi:hypothetical protein
MIDPMYIISEVFDKYFRIDWGDMASPNIFSVNDPDKPPIKNIIDPDVFGLLFITLFRFNIDHFPVSRYSGLRPKFISIVKIIFKKNKTFMNDNKCIQIK